MYSPGLPERKLDSFISPRKFSLNLPTSCLLDTFLHFSNLIQNVLLVIFIKRELGFVIVSFGFFYLLLFCIYCYLTARSDVNPDSRGYGKIREYAFMRLIVLSVMISYGTFIVCNTFYSSLLDRADESIRTDGEDGVRTREEGGMIYSTVENQRVGYSVGAMYFVTGLVMVWTRDGFVCGLQMLKKRIVGEGAFTG